AGQADQAGQPAHVEPGAEERRLKTVVQQPQDRQRYRDQREDDPDGMHKAFAGVLVRGVAGDGLRRGLEDQALDVFYLRGGLAPGDAEPRPRRTTLLPTATPPP